MENSNNEKTFQMRISSINTLRFSQFDIEDINIDRKYIIEYESNFGIRLFEATDEIGHIISPKTLLILKGTSFDEAIAA